MSIGRSALGASFLASLMVAACVGSTDETVPDRDVGSGASALYGGGQYQFWPNGVVPVCWVSGTNQPSLQAQARAIVDQTWASVAQVTFTGWGTCATDTPPEMVAVHFATGTRGRTWGIGFQPNGSRVEIASDASASVFRYQVIHEFGHVLGFVHEQERPDNWSGATPIHCGRRDDDASVDPKGANLTEYDPDSVMNYCAGQPQYLSRLDAVGARRAYPPHVESNLAPAVATNSNGAIFFATDLTGTVRASNVVLGEGNDAWRPVGDGFHTDAPPAAARLGKTGYVYAAAKGLDQRVYLDVSAYGLAWNDWVADGFPTRIGPGMASTPDGLMLFAVDSDGIPWVKRKIVGQTDSAWSMLYGANTDQPPAAAVCGNAPYVFVAVRGRDGYLRINQADIGGAWVGWQTDWSIQTDTAPALVSTPDGVIFFVKDLQGRIFSNRVVLGQAGQGWVQVPGLVTSVATGVGVTGNAPYLFLLARGASGSVVLNQGSIGGAWVGWSGN